MPADPARPCAPLSRLTLALCAAALTSACDPPAFPGPQIQTPPPAFYRQPEAYQQRRMFPERELRHHDAWVETSDGNFSGIYIDGYEGVLTEDDVIRAQAAATAREQQPVSYGPVERLTIDERPAFGWSEILRTPERGIIFVAYRAVVPYDTMSYAIEFVAGDPGFKVRPDSVKKIVTSFAIGRTEWNLPLIAVLVGVGLFAIQVARGRAREKQRRLQSITLRKIPKKEEDEGAKEGDEAAMPGSAGGKAASAGSPGSAPRPGRPPSAPPGGSPGGPG